MANFTIKKARHVTAGDVIFDNGKCAVVEYAQTLGFTREVKVHTQFAPFFFSTDADILVANVALPVIEIGEVRRE